MANPFYVEPANPLQALMLGVQGYEGGQQGGARSRAAEKLQAGDTQGAFAELIRGGATKDLMALAQYQNAANSVYGTPIYGTDPSGNTAIGTFDKKGQFRQINTPGFTPTPGIKTIETPQGVHVIGARTGAPIGGGQSGPVGGGAAMPGAQPAVPPQPGSTQPLQPRPVQTQSFYPADNRGKARDVKVGSEEGEKISGLGQAKAALDTSTNSLDRLAFEANRIMKDPALSRITGLPGIFPNWPGGAAANVQAKLETLKSQSGFAVLQAMRDASKTGGALGSITEGEHRLLQSNLAALDQAQSPQEFQKAMKQIVEYAEGAKQRLKQAYDTDYASLNKPQQPQQAQQPQRGGLPPMPKVGEQQGGYRYKGGDPADPASWVQIR